MLQLAGAEANHNFNKGKCDEIPVGHSLCVGYYDDKASCKASMYGNMQLEVPLGGCKFFESKCRMRIDRENHLKPNHCRWANGTDCFVAKGGKSG